MMKFCVFLVLVLCISQSSADSNINNKIPRCSRRTISQIQLFWEGAGVPRGILSSLKAEGTSTLLQSTAILPIADTITIDAKCVFGDFTENSAKFTVVANNPQLQSKKGSNVFSYGESEEDGIVTEDNLQRYIIMKGHGVTLFYICNIENRTFGTAAGGIAVAVKSLNDPDTLAVASTARGISSLLGLYLSKTYDDAACPTVSED